MKLIRTARSHEALAFGPDDTTDLETLDPGDIVTVDHGGIVVNDADAKRYEDFANSAGVLVIVEDAPEGAKSGDEPPTSGLDPALAQSPTPTPPTLGRPGAPSTPTAPAGGSTPEKG